MGRNGYLAPSELTSIGGGLFLRAGATAQSWLNMKAAAATEGASIHSTATASAYRPWAMQLDMRANPGRYQILPGMIPGLPSGHGDGNCRDVYLGAPNNWMIRRASAWGWSRPIASDPNHWRHDGVTLGPNAGTAGSGAVIIPGAPAPSLSGENDMRFFGEVGGGIYFATAAGVTGVDNPEHLAVLQRVVRSGPDSIDTFNGVQRDWIINYISRAQNDVGRQAALIAAINAQGMAIREHGQAVENNSAAALAALIVKQGSPEPYKFTPEELAAIGVGVAPVDTAVLVAAIKQSQADVLAAIAQVDENTLASFGLKRA